MTIHKIKLRDLDEKFIQDLRDKLGDENIELEIRISAGYGDCAGQEMNERSWNQLSAF